MNFKRSGDILKITSLQKTETITASGSGQIWYETDSYNLKFNTPYGDQIIA